jgi:peptidoglycan hydrolase-like protein with peptidoglycan-binding domain
LQQQVATLSGGSPATWCHTFSTNLEVGSTGADVTALQTALSKDGESVIVNGAFDDQTASAVTGFQQKYASDILTPNGLQNGTGYAGRATRSKLNSLFGCSYMTPTPISPVPSAPAPIYTPNSPTISPASAGQPTLKMINWGSGQVGQQLVLTGTGFLASGNAVYMNGMLAASNLSSSDGVTLNFTVPAYLTSNSDVATNVIQVIPNTYAVSVGNENGTSNGVPFIVIGPSNTTSSEIVTVSQNTELGVVTAWPGETSVKIGSYLLSTTSTSEGAQVNYMRFVANVNYLQNLRIFLDNGQQYGVTQRVVNQGVLYTISGQPFIVRENVNVVVNLYADMTTSASGTASAATTFGGCQATGVLDYIVIPCNETVQGQGISIQNSPLTVSQNSAFGNQDYSPGQTSVEVGSYSFITQPTTGVQVNNVSIQADAPFFQNLKLLVNGAQFGTTQGVVISGQTYGFSGNPFVIPESSSTNVDVYADIPSSAPTGTANPATTLTGCNAMDQSSYALINCNAVAGQGITVN